MLAKKERLNRTAFDRFFVSGKRYNSPYFQLIYTPYKNFHGSVVVGKKVYKKAVLRNRLRRQVYGVLYRNKTTLKIGVYICIAKPASTSLLKGTIIIELEKLLKQM